MFGTGPATAVQITDLDAGKQYPLQKMTAVPYAMRVPVDGETVGFDEDGKLSLLSSVVDGGNNDGKVMTIEAGKPVWQALPEAATNGLTANEVGNAVDVKINAFKPNVLKKADFQSDGLVQKFGDSWSLSSLAEDASAGSVVKRDGQGKIISNGLTIKSASDGSINIKYDGTSLYTLNLPQLLPTETDSALVSDLNGTLSWKRPIFPADDVTLGNASITGDLSVNTINGQKPVMANNSLRVWTARIKFTNLDRHDHTSGKCKLLDSSNGMLKAFNPSSKSVLDKHNCPLNFANPFLISVNKICNCTAVTNATNSERCSLKMGSSGMHVKTDMEVYGATGEAHIICYTGG